MGGPFGGGGLPAEKPKNLKGSFARLAGTLRPEAPRIGLVIALAILSVTCALVGPKILGNATDIIFDGIVSQQIPPGLTQQQAVDALNAAGQTQQADMLASMTRTPGQGIDFTALRDTLLFVAVIYIVSSLFAWGQSYIMAGVTQRTVYRMRRDVDAKLSRLPLRYFDSHPRGDTLSRVTNDIDNIGNSLQQTLTQLITALCTIIGVLLMMFWISPLLAIISLLTVPLSIAVTVFIAKRSSVQFARQWAQTGKLNGHVEEMHTGHSIVKAFGHQDEAIATFDEENEQLFQASYRAQFLSGTIQPAMQFIANINYVLIGVIGGIQVANGLMSLGDVQAFVQYSRQFTMPITQTASIANVIQSAVASAERVFELLDEGEESEDVQLVGIRPAVTGRVELEHVSFRYLPEVPLIEDLNLVVEPG